MAVCGSRLCPPFPTTPRSRPAFGQPERATTSCRRSSVLRVGLFIQVKGQPRGLLHQDLRPDNIGWLGGRAEMVVFDLQKNAWGPRFADVAPYLAMPDWSRDAAFLDDSEGGARSRREVLIEHYLDEYTSAGGLVVTPEIFCTEASALAWAHRVTVLSWLAPDWANGAGTGGSGLSSRIRCRDLNIVGSGNGAAPGRDSGPALWRDDMDPRFLNSRGIQA